MLLYLLKDVHSIRYGKFMCTFLLQKGNCQFVKELAVVNVTSWAILPANDENAIQAAVAHIGPIAVSINATPKTFQLYR